MKTKSETLVKALRHMNEEIESSISERNKE